MWDPHNIPILSEKAGKIGFRDMIPGVTVKRELDDATGRIADCRYRAQGRLEPDRNRDQGREPARSSQLTPSQPVLRSL